MPDFVFEERDYQQEAVSNVLAYFDKGSESVLLESPVGSGKMVMGLMAVAALQKKKSDLRVNWVACRRHILDQVNRMNDSHFHCHLNTVSVFASSFPPADLVVLDEAHHEATRSCLAMYEQTGNSLTLGLSATPLRTDRLKLAFQHTVKCKSVPYFIRAGVLSPYHSYKLPLYSPDTVASVFCERPEHWGKTLAFFRTVKECSFFKNRLLQAGISCEVISAQSDKDALLDAFMFGGIQVLANVAVLSEGFDLPELKTVLVRDASRLPTIQMAGRGLRKAVGKSHCNIIQSEEAAFQIEKLALPARSFRYMNGQWLSCTDDTQIIMETMENSLHLLEQRRVRLPYCISDTQRRKIEVTLMKRRTVHGRG